MPVLHADADGLGRIDGIVIERSVAIDGPRQTDAQVVIHGRNRIDFDFAGDLLDALGGCNQPHGRVHVFGCADVSTHHYHAILHADADGVEGVAHPVAHAIGGQFLAQLGHQFFVRHVAGNLDLVLNRGNACKLARLFGRFLLEEVHIDRAAQRGHAIGDRDAHIVVGLLR